MKYSLQCWDDGSPAMIEHGAEFPSREEAMLTALELACNHQAVELRQAGVLVAYLSQPRTDLIFIKGTIH